MPASDFSRRLDVSAPYPEASTLFITRALRNHGLLARLYAPVPIGTFARRCQPRGFGNGSRSLAERFSRWDVGGDLDEVIVPTGSVVTIISAAARRVPGFHRTASRVAFAAKVDFDRLVMAARDDAADGILGLHGSSMLTFRNTTPGRIRVLNHVNGHPTEHNDVLRQFAGLPADHPEMVPDAPARRMAAEAHLADLVITPSRQVLSQLVKQGVDPRRILAVPYGVDSDLFRPRQRPSTIASLRCVYVGQISYRKGLQFLSEAARSFPSIAFDLIGPMVSPEVLRGAPDNIRWLGAQGHGRVAGSLPNYDVFVLPSLEDSFGLVAAEAAAAGLPVVISSAAGASEVLEPNGAALVVDPGSVASLVRAIERLADEPDLRRELGAHGRSWPRRP